jgi:hypothetical protein
MWRCWMCVLSPYFLLIAHGFASCCQAKNMGIHIVTAANNGGTNICDVRHYSSDDELLINVGATDADDKITSVSNFGPCVDCECRS